MIDFLHWQIKIKILCHFTITAITLIGLCSGVAYAENSAEASNDAKRLEHYLKGETLPNFIPEQAPKRTSANSRRSQIPGNVEFHYVRLSSVLSTLVEKDHITKADIQQLLPIYEDFKGNHLLLLNRLQEDQERINRLGLNSDIVFRHSSELSRYLELSEGLIASLDGLSAWAKKEDSNNLFIDLWQKLLKFYYELRLSFNVDDVIEQVKKGKESIILHASNDLPYRGIAFNSRLPKTEPEITPSYLQENLLEAKADSLKSTSHSPLSELITKQAAVLDYDAIKIYEFVHNEIDTQWYAGAMKGAENTLRQKSGNDVDQASLLIALLRASSIPAHYVSGVVEIPVSHIQQQTGIQNPSDIASFINKAGYASQALIQGGKVAKLNIEYTWVSALVSYANYRGTQIDSRGKAWVPLAPAFKQYSGESSKDLISTYALNQSQLLNEYLSTQKPNSPLSAVQSLLEQALVEDNKAAQLSNYKNRQQITKKNLGYLPNSLPMQVRAVISESANLSANQQQWVHFQIKDENDRQIILDAKVPLASLDSRRVTLSYLPETIDDQNLINAFGGMTNVPSYLVSLRPQIKIEGRVVAAGSGGVPMGDYHNLSISIQSPAGTEYFERALLSGSYHALGFVSQEHDMPYDSSVQSAGDSEHLGARLLAQIALRYSKSWMQNEQDLAELNGLTLVRPLPALTIASNSYKKESILNVVYSLEWHSVTLDAIFKPVDSVVNDVNHNLLITKQQKQKTWMQTSALEGSYLEHKIFENDFAVKSISADQGLAIAYETGNPVHKINFSTQNLIATLNQNENVKENIQYWVSQNYEVLVPQNPVSKSAWTGAVWQVQNPNTGATGYLISGSLAGGETAQSEWPDKNAQNAIQYLWDGFADENSIVGSINVIGDSWITGKPKEEVELKVLVSSITGLPMANMLVNFSISDGIGLLTTENPVTNAEGIVTFTYHFGTDVSKGRTFFVADQSAGDAHPQQTGLSFAEFSVTQEGISKSTQSIFQLFPGDVESFNFQYTGLERDSLNLFSSYRHWGSNIQGQALDNYGNPIANSQITITLKPGIEGETYAYSRNELSYIFTDGFKINPPAGIVYPGSLLNENVLYQNAYWGDHFWYSGGLFDIDKCQSPNHELWKCASLSVNVVTDSLGLYSVGHIWANSGFDSTITIKEQKSNFSQSFEYSQIMPDYQLLRSSVVISQLTIDGIERNHAVLKNSVSKTPVTIFIEKPSPTYVSIEDNLALSYFWNDNDRNLNEALVRHNESAQAFPQIESYIPVNISEFNVSSDKANILYKNPKAGVIELDIVSGSDLGEIEFDYNASVSWLSKNSRVSIADGRYNTDGGRPPLTLGGPRIQGDTVPNRHAESNIWVVEPKVLSVSSIEGREGLAFDKRGKLIGKPIVTLQLLPEDFNPFLTYIELYENDELIDRSYIAYDKRTYTAPPNLVFYPNKSYSIKYFINDENVASEPFTIPFYQDIFVTPEDGQRFKKVTRVDVANNWVCEAGKGEITFEISHKSDVSLSVKTDSGSEDLVHAKKTYEKGIYTLGTGPHQQGSYILEAVSSFDGHVETREGNFRKEISVIDSLPIGHTLVEGVDIFDGSLNLSRNDLSVGGRGLGLNLTRSYNSNSDHVGVLGKGWTHNYSMQLVSQGCGAYRITGGLSAALFFSEISTTENAFGELVEIIESFKPGKGYHGSLVKGEQANTWDYFSKDGTRYHLKQFPFDSDNESWHLEYVEDPWGNRNTITYISPESQLKLQDPFFWDNSLVSKVTDSSQRSLVFTYEILEKTENINWAGEQIPKNYRHNRLVNVKGPENYNVDYLYEPEGSLISANVRGALETYEYKRHPYVKGEFLSFEENLTEGLLTKVTNPRGFETDYSYNVNELSYTLDEATHGVKKAFVTSISRDLGDMVFTWGQRTDRTTQLTTSVNNFRGIKVDYTLDSYGLSLSQSVPEKIFTWNSDHYVVESETLIKGAGDSDLTIEYEYDQFANVIKQTIGNSETSFEYLPPLEENIEGGFIKNLMSSKTDANNNVTEYAYEKNRVTEINYPDNSREAYNYAENGDLKSKIDKLGKTVSYNSDVFGYIIEEKYSDCCNKNYTFNALGEMLTETNGLGQTISYTYNPRGHLIGKNIGIGSPEIYTVDSLGNRLTETDFRAYQKTWSDYNELNQPQTITWDIGSQTINKTLSYDAHGNKLTESDWRGTVTTYTYNFNDHLISESTKGSPAINITYKRDASGFVTLEDQGSGRTRAYTYNALHNILSDTDGEGGELVAQYDDHGNQTSRTDRNGNKTRFSYDAMHRVISKILPSGLGTYTYAYDGNGNPISETRPDGTLINRSFSQANQLLSEKVNKTFVLRNEYDKAGNLLFTLNGINETTLFSGYDILGRPSEKVLPAPLNPITYTYTDEAPHSVSENTGSNTVVNTYDAQNNLIVVRDSMGQVSEFTRDANGNVLVSKDANGNETTRTYNSLNQVATEESPSGLATHNTWDAFNNLITSVVGPLTLSYTYDKRNARLSETDNVGSTTWVYDAEGNVTKVTDKNNNNTTTSYDGLNKPASIQEPIGVLRRIQYDGLGRLIQDMDRKGIITTYQYDAFNNPITTTRDRIKILSQEFDSESNLKTSIDAKGHTTTYEYFPQGILKTIRAPELAITRYDIDGVGNRISQSDNIPRSTTWSYDARKRVLSETKPGNRKTQFSYDGKGNLLSKTLPDGNSWAYTYNTLDQILSIEGPENTGLRYSYDNRGNKTIYTDAKGQRSSYFYDALNRLTSIDAPVLAAHTFAYDPNDNLVAETDSAGNALTYAYDGLNREIEKTISPANGFINSVTQVNTSYDANGNVLSVTETGPQAATARFSYDNFNRMTSKTDQNGKTISYGYDLNGNRSTLSSRLSFTVSTHQTGYSFDGLNRVSTVIADGQTTTYSYFNDSQLKKIAYPSGISANYLYNGAGFLHSINNVKSGSTISNVSYTYDANGNRTEQIQNNGFGNVNTTYDYDGADRLTKEHRKGGEEVVSTYNYDVNSNRETETQTINNVSTKNLSYTYNARDQLTHISNNLNPTQNITYSYDGNGNRISKTQNTESNVYSYNAANQLVTAKVNNLSVGQFAYDHQGLRIKKIGERGTENYVYDDQSVLYQTDANDNLTAKYNYAVQGCTSAATTGCRGAAGTLKLLSITEANKAAQYYLFDGLGSPITLTQSDGSVTARYSYDAFGNKILNTGTSANRFAFTGHEEDKETDLIYMKARFYDPDTGQFLTEDNFGGFPDTPPSLNKYLYAYGNPTLYVDPDGNVAIVGAGINMALDLGIQGIEYALSDEIEFTLDKESLLISAATGAAGVGLADKAAKLANIAKGAKMQAAVRGGTAFSVDASVTAADMKLRGQEITTGDVVQSTLFGMAIGKQIDKAIGGVGKSKGVIVQESDSGVGASSQLLLPDSSTKFIGERLIPKSAVEAIQESIKKNGEFTIGVPGNSTAFINRQGDNLGTTSIDAADLAGFNLADILSTMEGSSGLARITFKTDKFSHIMVPGVSGRSIKEITEGIENGANRNSLFTGKGKTAPLSGRNGFDEFEVENILLDADDLINIDPLKDF